MNASLESTQRSMQTRYGALTNALGNLGRALTIGVTMPIMGIGVAAANAALQMDSLERGLIAVAGSEARARQEMAELREVAKLPGLGYAEAIQGSIRLQAVGESAAEAARNMRAFGNAIATVGGGKAELAGVITQLMQMESKGKIMMEDIRIIQQYVPQISAAMKAAFGTASAEEIAKQGITAKQFIAAIVTELEKLPRVSGGVKNSLENLADDTQRALAAMGKAMLPAIASAAESLAKLAERFEHLSPTTQRFILVTAAAAAALGPLCAGLNAVVKTMSTVRAAYTGAVTWIAAKRAAMAADAATTTAHTVVTGNAAVAEGALATALTAEAGAANASVAATTAASTAQVALGTTATGAAIGVGALRAALMALNPAALAIGVAAAAAVGGILFLINTIRNTENTAATQARTAVAMSKRDAQDFQNFWRGAFSKWNEGQLESYRRSLNERIGEHERALEDAQRRSAWWRPGSAIARGDVESERATLRNLRQRLQMVQEEIDARRAGTSASQMAAQAAREDEQKRRETIAAAERSNAEARASLWVLNASNEFERERREAWIELVEKKRQIAQNVRDARDKTGATIDLTDQIRLAEAQYAAKLRDINSRAAQAAADQSVAAQVATINLAALQTTNEFEAQRLQLTADLVRTLHDLKRQKSSEAEQRLAIEQYNRQIAEINQREAESTWKTQFETYITNLRAEATAANDKFRLARIEALERFGSAMADAVRTGGALGAARERLAWAELNATRQRIDEEARQDAEQKQREALQQVREQRRAYQEQLARQAELEAELAPTPRAAMAARARAEQIRWTAAIVATEEQLEMAKTQEARDRIMAEQETRELEHRRTLIEIANNYLDKLREWKNREVEAWRERADAIRQYAEQARSAISWMAGPELWERAVVAEMRMLMPVPALPPQPSTEPTPEDIRRFDEQSQAAQTQTELLRRLVASVENLALGRSTL